ncbi:M20/M25/M40 family metallo-hydrolase [Yunchengibacter salinarum]|uniref:M20/M25/M40 family metallo-hydrolase n=1 Tax=Yunchengibacter salinarum TaxID=3133399 RepID=UPI0035B61187
MTKRLIAVLAASFAILVAVMWVRAERLGDPAPLDAMGIKPPEDGAAAEAAARRLAGALRFRTISRSVEAPLPREAFTGLHAYLAETYPAFHRVAEREVIGQGSLMYRWPGRDGGADPVGFLAHLDVVPVEKGTEAAWTHPPFDGVVADGIIWGRGTLDDKGSVIALLEAAEKLAAAGERPARDVYFLFGHDEELGGDRGARVMARTLTDRGITLDWTLDEGSALMTDLVPGVQAPIAMVSVAEKGSVTLKITATADGGHSSAPARETAVSLLARGVRAVSDHPYPLVLDETLADFLTSVAPHMPWMQRMAIANLWLTQNMLAGELGRSPTVAAAMHTTTAPTVIRGGTKTNILPQAATAYVNYRIHPRNSVDSVLARARSLMPEDLPPGASLKVEKAGSGRNATPPASTDADGYKLLESVIRDSFGPVPVAPATTIVGTDSRHFQQAARNTYRFSPFGLTKDSMKRIHGTDEHMPVAHLAAAIRFYERLFKGL